MPASKKKSNKQTATKKKKKSTNVNKSRGPAFGGNISWGSKSKIVKEDDSMPMQQKIGIAIAAFLLFMIALYVFVDDTPPPTATTQSGRPVKNTTSSGPRKEFEFTNALLLNSTTLIPTIEEQSEDRLVVVTYDDSSQQKETEGKASRLRSFRRMETLARGLSRKTVFKRYEDADLPLICVFDCGSSADQGAEDLCNRIMGQNAQSRQSTVIYSNKRGRALPTELRSDKQIVLYLYKLMQPPVKYLDEPIDAEEFVATSSSMNVLYFGKDSDVYTTVADNLRDFAQFGRAQNPKIIDTFAEVDSENLPALGIWRTFGTNPLMFPTDSGNISDPSQISAFVLNNFLPLCGEFNAKTQQKYMKRGIPVAFVVVDKELDSEKYAVLVDEVSQMARSYLGAVSFATLDADEYPQLVENIGVSLGGKKKAKDDDGETDEDEDAADDDSEDKRDVLPQIAIHVQQYSEHGPIDLNDVRTSIFNVVDPYVEQLRQEQARQRSQGGGGEAATGGADESEMEVEDDDGGDDDDELPEDDVPAPKMEV